MDTIKENDPEIREKVFHISSSGTYIELGFQGREVVNIYHIKLVVRDYGTRITIQDELSRDDEWITFVLASTLRTIRFATTLTEEEKVTGPQSPVPYWDIHKHYPRRDEKEVNEQGRIMIAWEPSSAQRKKLDNFSQTFFTNPSKERRVILNFAPTEYSKSNSGYVLRKFKYENDSIEVINSCLRCSKPISIGCPNATLY